MRCPRFRKTEIKHTGNSSEVVNNRTNVNLSRVNSFQAKNAVAVKWEVLRFLKLVTLLRDLARSRWKTNKDCTFRSPHVIRASWEFAQVLAQIACKFLGPEAESKGLGYKMRKHTQVLSRVSHYAHTGRSFVTSIIYSAPSLRYTGDVINFLR